MSSFTRVHLSSIAPDAQGRQIYTRMGRATIIQDGDVITKQGRGVTRNEEAALLLVKQHTNVNVPDFHSSSYDEDEGTIRMSFLPGEVLEEAWPRITDDETKERICRQTWDLIQAWRHIPKPAEYAGLFQCGVDGTASDDILIEPMDASQAHPLESDEALRARIYERYANECRERSDGKDFQQADELPRSDRAVFTHGDINPRNIMIEGGDRPSVSGIFDWQTAGWYPVWWEYANIMRWGGICSDWPEWMNRTAPERYDLKAIYQARKLLF